MPGFLPSPVPDDAFSVSGYICLPENSARYFSEDPLLILHLLRVSSVLDQPIETKTGSEIKQNAFLLKNALPAALSDDGKTGAVYPDGRIPTEIFSRIIQLLCGSGVGRLLRSFPEVFTLLFPPLLPTVGYDQQNPHHLYSVYEHTIRAVENVPPDPVLRLTMLLHDTGKPLARTTDENGIGHYAGHQKISAALTRKTLAAWYCDSAFIDQVALLVEAHDIPLSTDPVLLARRLRKFGEGNLRKLFLIHMADRIATGTRNPDHARDHCRELEEALDRLLKQKE